MLEFNIKKTRISIDFTFFAVIAFFCMLESGKYFLHAFSACIIHETGHLAVMTLFGIGTAQLRLSGTGMRIVPKKNRVCSVRRDIAVLLGGSAVNIILWAVLVNFESMQLFAYINLFLGVFNLMPYRSLDGGEAIMTLVEHCGCGNNGSRINRVLMLVNLAMTAAIAAAAVSLGFMSFMLVIMLIWLAADELLR